MNKLLVSIIFGLSFAAATPAQAAWYDWIPGISFVRGNQAQNRRKIRAGLCQLFVPKKVELWKKERNLLLDVLVTSHNLDRTTTNFPRSFVTPEERKLAYEMYEIARKPAEVAHDRLQQVLNITERTDVNSDTAQLKYRTTVARTLRAYEEWLLEPLTILDFNANRATEYLPNMKDKLNEKSLSSNLNNNDVRKEHLLWRQNLKKDTFLRQSQDSFLKPWLAKRDIIKAMPDGEIKINAEKEHVAEYMNWLNAGKK